MPQLMTTQKIKPAGSPLTRAQQTDGHRFWHTQKSWAGSHDLRAAAKVLLLHCN
jgi:hypothetical protein